MMVSNMSKIDFDRIGLCCLVTDVRPDMSTMRTTRPLSSYASSDTEDDFHDVNESIEYVIELTVNSM
jgi:hypothetical protein